MNETERDERDDVSAPLLFGQGQAGWLAVVTVISVVALVLAFVAVVMASGDDGGGGTAAPAGGEVSEQAAAGEQVYADNCASCHGGGGEGGVGPALDTVTETFVDPATQVEWVTIGSDGWLEAHGDTYGDTAKPVAGGMPAFEGTLSAEEIDSVVAYERETFGS